MNILRKLFWCIVLGLTACDQTSTGSISATPLPDRDEIYKPSPEELARADSLTDFEGKWLGKVHVISDPNGLYREYTDGLDFRIYVDDSVGWAEVLLNGEWTTFTGESAHIEKDESSILISMFLIEGAYGHTVTIAMHRAEPDTAKVWLIRTSGTPFRSGDDVWKNYAVFAEGEVRSVD